MSNPEKVGPTPFEVQRDALVKEIATAMDSVLCNLDTLNRSLHDSIQVGKEFENVGLLWSTFYNSLQAQKDLGLVELETRETSDTQKTDTNNADSIQ